MTGYTYTLGLNGTAHIAAKGAFDAYVEIMQRFDYDCTGTIYENGNKVRTVVCGMGGAYMSNGALLDGQTGKPLSLSNR